MTDQSTSTFFNASKNRSFGSGHSSLKGLSAGRNNRSASIGFAQTRNSQRSSDIGMKNIMRNSFSESFDFNKSLKKNKKSIENNGDSFTLDQLQENTSLGFIYFIIVNFFIELFC